MTKEFTYYYNKLKEYYYNKLKEYSNNIDTLEDLIKAIENDYRNGQKITYDEMELLLVIANFLEKHM